jgi:DNA repair protein RecN (Recombination protein N)
VLRELRVKDLALVAGAKLEFGPGLNLLTGETGSGKSLIVDALGLSLGGRANTDQVRHGAERAQVEAVFESADGPALQLTREIGRRSSARLNGQAVNPGQLRELGRTLVGIHGQHEHQALMDSEAQTLLLDAFSGAIEDRERVAQLHGAWKQAENQLHDLERLRARGQREEEYLQWQLDELRGAELRAGEDEDLLAERLVARHAVRLTELAALAVDGLTSAAGVAAAVASTRAAGELDRRLHELAERVDVLDQEARDMAGELRRYAETLDPDPSRLETIEARLAQLEAIKRKYGGSLEAAISEQRRLESQLGGGENLEASIEAAQQAVARSREGLESSCEELSRRRSEGAAGLEAAVTAELQGLRLEGSRFHIELRPLGEIGPGGAEAVEMMFSANPGEPLRPLARVASGGELARVMLAIKTAGAAADSLPTLIFDEVDAGIGGEAAIQVGLRLKALGERHQVLVVTHLAQIACFADHHLVVRKVAEDDGRNVVTVRELGSKDERAAELARMMSGSVTEKALARAHELLEEAAS